MFLSEWREFPSAPCLAGGKKNLAARVSMLLKSRASLTCFRATFLPGRAKGLSAPRYETTPRDLRLPRGGRCVNEIFGLLGYCVVLICSFRSFGTTNAANRMSRNVGNYQSTLRGIPTERNLIQKRHAISSSTR